MLQQAYVQPQISDNEDVDELLLMASEKNRYQNNPSLSFATTNRKKKGGGVGNEHFLGYLEGIYDW